jgi:hypothetical protein
VFAFFWDDIWMKLVGTSPFPLTLLLFFDANGRAETDYNFAHDTLMITLCTVRRSISL